MLTTTKPAAWRPAEWRSHVPMSQSQLAEYIREGYIHSVKIGGARYILESPTDFIERHRPPAKK
jgi:predicted site-specific integrase-resolvase